VARHDYELAAAQLSGWIGDDEAMTEGRMRFASASNPSGIRNASLPKSLRGFDETATRNLLAEVAAVVESLTAERENLRRQVESLQAAAVSEEPISPSSHVDESPEALGNAILAAKHAGEELLAAAQQEADQILSAAAAEADRLAEQARAKTADRERELDERQARFKRERAEHQLAVNDWSTKIEAEREAMMAQARAEVDAVVAAEERKLSELQREEEQIRALIGARQMQSVSMLRAALRELEALVSLDEADEIGSGDLPIALQTRVGSPTRGEADGHNGDEALSE
jgi:cell division septum initiation protein DivIVA